MAAFISLLLRIQAIGPKLWARRETALLLTTSLGMRKIAEEGEERERRYIIIVSDVFHSNAAHIKEGREEREREEKRR